MTGKITLSCIVSGDSTPFSVDVLPGKTIGHLKNKIKEEKAPRFDDITADVLGLYKVSIPEKDQVIVESDIKSETESHVPLEPSSAEISKYFDSELPQRTIHLFIKLPQQ
ncbi:hypothetical protein BGZ83_000547, partial [Gryganskiella cystojenkinii]